MIFETHAHYDDDQFDEDRVNILTSLLESGVNTVINVSSSLKSIEKTCELTRNYNFIYGAVGIHPEECGKLNQDNFNYVKEMVLSEKVVAVGEIGLDYHWKEPERDIQKHWFREQIELARQAGLPMIIHSRDAAQDTFTILKEHKAEEIGGVIHCFSYGIDMAKAFLDMGFYIGVGGVITFKNAKKLKEAVEYIPMNRIVLETDSPYLAPEPNRGKRNSSQNLCYVASEIAKIKGLDYDEVVEITEKNAEQLFRMKAE